MELRKIGARGFFRHAAAQLRRRWLAAISSSETRLSPHLTPMHFEALEGRMLLSGQGIVLIEPDRFEPNGFDDPPTDLGFLGQRTESGLSLHEGTDEDSFVFTALADGQATIDLFFTHSEGDLDLIVFDGEELVGFSDSQTDNEQTIFNVSSGVTYFIAVISFDEQPNPSYDLAISSPVGPLQLPNLTSSADVPKAIPDNDATGVVSTLTGPDLVIGDVNLFIEELTHPRVQDLHVELTSPMGTTVTLIAAGSESGILGNGTSADFFSTLIDDEAFNSLDAGAAPFIGRFNVNHSSITDHPLSAFLGENAQGTWTLRVSDLSGTQAGSLDAWGLQFSAEAGPDRFEPNDTFDDATDLGTLDETIESNLSIHDVLDEDFFSFVPQTTGLSEIQILFNQDDVDLDLEVFNANEDSLGYSETETSNERVVIPVVAGQRYYIDVYPYDIVGNPSYELRINPIEVSGDDEPNDSIDNATETGLAGLGQVTHSGFIGDGPFPNMDVDLYHVFLPAGLLFIADIEAEAIGSPLDSALVLFNADGEEVAYNDDAGFSVDSALKFIPEESGDYYIGVNDYPNDLYDPFVAGSGEPHEVGGEYNLTLSIVTPPDPDRLESDDAFEDATDLGVLGDHTESGLSIHAPFNSDFFVFEAAASGTLNISLLFSHAQGDIDVAIYAGNQAFLDETFSETDNEFLTIEVVAGERYYVEVFGFDGNINPQYELVIDAPGAPVGSISGTVYDDVNADGAMTGGESPLEGVVVYLDLNDDGMLDGLDAELQTDASGAYSFTDITPGVYRVRVVAPDGWLATDPESGARQITVGGNEDVTNVAFGVADLGDVNRDGVRDATDIDALFAITGPLAPPGESPDQTYNRLLDLNKDGHVNGDDLRALVEAPEYFATLFGDATLDRRVSIGDLTLLAENFGLTENVGWAQGDFTGDGRTSIGDLVVLAENFGQDVSAGPLAGAQDDSESPAHSGSGGWIAEQFGNSDDSGAHQGASWDHVEDALKEAARSRDAAKRTVRRL